MTDRKWTPHLHGWDDEKVYYTDESCKEWCVSDHPDLVARLIEICREYFEAGPGSQRSEPRNPS